MEWCLHTSKGQDERAQSCLNVHHHRNIPAYCQSFCKCVEILTLSTFSAEQLNV